MRIVCDAYILLRYYTLKSRIQLTIAYMYTDRLFNHHHHGCSYHRAWAARTHPRQWPRFFETELRT